ncbi:uncharacterized protein LOC106138157 [Amyelois transitella]|uniref:uncharacterized protein LOC106138157 n=1 Tax=Amyelois transitella TaxID=680683 RepID=UPI00298F983A|nr:uncharacterized protein LOC106138157 [Amyelois transitella]
MDLKGSLVDTNVRIYPSQKLKDFIKTIPINRTTPYNIAKLAKDQDFIPKNKTESVLKPKEYEFNKKDIENINKIKNKVNLGETARSNTEVEHSSSGNENSNIETTEKGIEKANLTLNKKDGHTKDVHDNHKKSDNCDTDTEEFDARRDEKYLVTNDIDWIYKYLKEKRNEDKDVPFLHVLLEGVDVVMPDNELIKRNPILEERCVKLRAQQEAREYRKMTKSVDNVRIRFPEDSISYQLKQLNRQLIVIGQFILSIFAGFLFGFKGVDWMIGNLDFGFRLLLGVMCALIIALAEIYFIAKKLNEELSVPETVQLGGPTKFAEEPTCHGRKITSLEKEHMD